MVCTYYVHITLLILSKIVYYVCSYVCNTSIAAQRNPTYRIIVNKVQKSGP